MVQNKKGGKDQESIKSSTTPDPGHYMGKKQNYNKHHPHEPRGQPFPSSRPQGSIKQTRKHDKHNAEITQTIHKRSTALEWSVKLY